MIAFKVAPELTTGSSTLMHGYEFKYRLFLFHVRNFRIIKYTELLYDN